MHEFSVKLSGGRLASHANAATQVPQSTGGRLEQQKRLSSGRAGPVIAYNGADMSHLSLYDKAVDSIIHRCQADLEALRRHRACFLRAEVIAYALQCAGVPAKAHCAPDGGRLELQLPVLTAEAELAIEKTGHYVYATMPGKWVIHSPREGAMPIWIAEVDCATAAGVKAEQGGGADEQ